MHRIDHSTALASMFTEGNPSVPIPATVVTAAILNAFQEEIVAVITDAGLALNKADNTQLLQALNLRRDTDQQMAFFLGQQ